MKLFVYHTPELTPTDELPDCAVVIDVLRATTTIAAALDAGAEAVQAFSSIDKLLETSESWPADKRLRAGERGGKQVEGCDTGNSPLTFGPERVGGRRLFISTTNGTRALQRVENAPTVITGAQVNRQAVVGYLKQTQPETVWLVGSGWEGSYSLEDTVCAGAIALPFFQEEGGEIVGNDEVAAAIALYAQWQDNLLELFHLASHGQRLLRLNNLDDLKYCAQTDILDVVPIQREKSVLVKFGG
ncbi:MAG: 2-phosphosulfolactate phosphatase family protein [Cyanobacteriota bacterium]|nr:2-phosphosulfolactate phosphatase family protein [Cyanobacteriota bacterium]